MEKKNIKLYIIPFIAVAIFSVILFGAGYAYFNSTLTMNTANYNITMPSTTSLICTKTDCSSTITPDMMTNTNYNTTNAKANSTCYVNCTCSGTPGAQCNYNVKLLELGTPYYPSTGVGTNKEFTAKVTSPSGCTTQNSSSTETQVNTIKDKIVSQCSLTVPSGGSVSANVSAEFKFYNLNLDQTQHANQVFKYELTTAERRIIYRTGPEWAYIGSSIASRSGWCAQGYVYDQQMDSCMALNLIMDSQEECEFLLDYLSVENGSCYQGSVNGLTNYLDDRNSIDAEKVYYLKHTVEDNRVQDSYVCIRYNEDYVLKEACILGGDGGVAYGTNSSSGSTGNIKIIQSTQHFFESLGGSCSYQSSVSMCTYGDFAFAAGSSGEVFAGNLDTYDGCRIEDNGNTYCTYDK